VSFAEFLHEYLSTRYPDTYRPHHLVRGVKEFTSTVKLQFSNNQRDDFYLLVGTDEEFEQGCIRLTW
jgi:hypothetical protein